MKICNICGEEKDFSEFYKNGTRTRTDGSIYQRYTASCKRCNDYEKYERTYLNIVQALKNLGREYKCEYCGYYDHSAALQFHHLDEKNKNISKMRGATIETLQKEISLCIVLCANCHAIEHCQYDF